MITVANRHSNPLQAADAERTREGQNWQFLWDALSEVGVEVGDTFSFPLLPPTIGNVSSKSRFCSSLPLKCTTLSFFRIKQRDQILYNFIALASQ